MERDIHIRVEDLSEEGATCQLFLWFAEQVLMGLSDASLNIVTAEHNEACS